MTFCEVDIADYTPRACGIDFAGIVGIAIIDFYEDPSVDALSSREFWESKFMQSPRKYHVIKNTRGGYQDADVSYDEDLVGYLVTGVSHQAVIDVPEVQENRDFWEAIKQNTWKLCLVTSGGLMYYVDKPVTFVPKIMNPRSVKEAAFFQVEMKWLDISNPYILEAPEGVFFGSSPLDEISGVFDYTYDDTFQ
jgi:hypothetical protein